MTRTKDLAQTVLLVPLPKKAKNVSSTIDMSIGSFLERCGFWLEFRGLIGQRLMTVGMRLEENSLSKAYFYVNDEDQIVFCTPVNCLVHTRTDGLKITILFQMYDCYGIDLVCPDGESFALMNGQLGLCAKVSVLSDDPFEVTNALFLRQFGSKMELFVSSERLAPMFPFEKSREARETWMKRTESQNRGYFTDVRDVSIMFYSWNVAEHTPEQADPESTKWVFKQSVDVVCLTLQEIDFTASAVIFGGSRMCKLWADFFIDIAVPCGYEIVRYDSLGSVFTAVFKKKEAKVCDHDVKPLRLGVNGWTANKAALISHFDVEGVNFGFVGVHLSAHEEYFDRRNEEMREIGDVLDSLPLDFSIIAGDLNYRVELPYQIAVDQLQSDNIAFLASHDQFARYRQSQGSKFQEAEIKFKPTYRFDPDCDVYDTSKKQRVPSWTDRVIVKTAGPWLPLQQDSLVFESDIVRHMDLKVEFQGTSNFSLDEPHPTWPSPPECIEYTSRQDVRLSDHRPVYAIYRFKVPQVNETRRSHFEEVRKLKYEDLISLSIPRCHVEPQSFKIDTQAEVVISNVSCAICTWKLNICPPGVTIQPTKGIIMPGGSSQVTVTCENAVAGIQVVMLDVEGGSPIIFEFSKDDMH